MSYWKNYIIARTLPEAVQALATSPNPVRLIGGGTDLLLDIQQSRNLEPIDTLVDVTRIPELNCLELRDESLFIGAGVPLRKIVASPIVHEHAEAVVEACGLIGGPQVRNSATLGGNVAHALPAADGTISLLAFDPQVEIASPDGRRMQPLRELFCGPGKSTLDPCRDILVGFSLPKRLPNQGSAFARIMRPQGVALPVLNMAAWIERNGGAVQSIRLAVGPGGAVPTRATAVEAALAGQEYGSATLEKAKAILRDSIRFRSSAMRASAAYRYELSDALLVEVVEKAWERAGKGE